MEPDLRGLLVGRRRRPARGRVVHRPQRNPRADLGDPLPGGGTELTETWTFLPKGIAGFHDRYGADAETQIAERTSAAHRGIPLTLAAIKKAAESS